MLYNDGTWNNYFLRIEGPASAPRGNFTVIAAMPFGTANTDISGYVQLTGCATLPNVTSFATNSNVLIAADSGFGFTSPQGRAIVSGDGFLNVVGSSTGAQFGIRPDSGNRLKYLFYQNTGTQIVAIDDMYGITATEVHFLGGTKKLKTHSTITADKVVVRPDTTLMNDPSYNWKTTVNAVLENYGTINNTSLTASGSIRNDGYFSDTNALTLTGTAPRAYTGAIAPGAAVTINSSFPFTNTPVVLGGNLTVSVSGTTINFVPDPNYLDHPDTDIDDYILEDRGNITNKPVILQMSAPDDPADRTELQFSRTGTQTFNVDLTADTVRLTGGGSKRAYRQKITGDLVVEAGTALITWSDVWSALTVFGDVTNRGSIANRTDGPTSNRDLKLYVTGDIDNDGSWTNEDTSIFWENNGMSNGKPVAVSGTWQLAFTSDPAQARTAAPETWPEVLTRTTSIYSVKTRIQSGTPYYWNVRKKDPNTGNWLSWQTFHAIDPVNTPPTVTRSGDNPLNLVTGATFTDPRATASDIEDGDLTAAITVTYKRLEGEQYVTAESVDTNTPGTYKIIYTVSDSGDLTDSEERIVNVAIIPTPTALAQINPTTENPIDADGKAAENTVEFHGVVTHPWGKQVRLVVGIQRLDPTPEELQTDPTAGEMKWPPALESNLVDNDTVVSVTLTPSASGNYRWIAKTKDEHGNDSEVEDSNETGEEITDFQYGFAPSPYGFSFANSKFDFNFVEPTTQEEIDAIDARIYQVFTTAFNLDDYPTTQDKQAAAKREFPYTYFNEGLCEGMGLTAMLSYGSQAYVQQHFAGFWNKLNGTGTGDGQGFLRNIQNSFLNGDYWNGNELGQNDVLDMIVRMQMWGKADWSELEYGEDPWVTQNPYPVLQYLQRSEVSEPTRKPFGSYGIIIKSTDIPPQGDLKAHFLIPYKLTTAEEDIENVQRIVNRIYVYDPNDSNEPNNMNKYLRIYQVGEVWKWDYMFGNTPLSPDTENINLIELSLPGGQNSQLPHLLPQS